MGLGWSAKEADRAVEAVAPDAEASAVAGRRGAAAGRPAHAEQGVSMERGSGLPGTNRDHAYDAHSPPPRRPTSAR